MTVSYVKGLLKPFWTSTGTSRFELKSAQWYKTQLLLTHLPRSQGPIYRQMNEAGHLQPPVQTEAAPLQYTLVCLSVCTCIFIVTYKEMLYCVYSYPLVSLSYFVQEKMLLSVQHQLLQWGQQPSWLTYLTSNVYLIWNILIYKWYAKTNAQIINITKFLFEKWMFVISSSIMLFHTYAISHRSWEIFPPHFFCSNLSGALGSQNPKNQVNNSLLISSLLPCFFCFRNKTQKIHILLIKIPFFFCMNTGYCYFLK